MNCSTCQAKLPPPSGDGTQTCAQCGTVYVVGEADGPAPTSQAEALSQPIPLWRRIVGTVVGILATAALWPLTFGAVVGHAGTTQYMAIAAGIAAFVAYSAYVWGQTHFGALLVGPSALLLAARPLLNPLTYQSVGGRKRTLGLFAELHLYYWGAAAVIAVLFVLVLKDGIVLWRAKRRS